MTDVMFTHTTGACKSNKIEGKIFEQTAALINVL